MPNRSTDELFQLIKSLETSEKRLFKLYVKRSTGSIDLKIIQLFDALDKMNEYDEKILLEKNKGIKKEQLSNIKASLYKQLLASLRLMKDEDNIDMQLHEQMGYAKILYNKGLYLQVYSCSIIINFPTASRHIKFQTILPVDYSGASATANSC